MHKDPKPGLFDLGGHSRRYTIILGLSIGMLAGIFLYGSFSLWRADHGGVTTGKSTAALEDSMAARRKATPTPVPTAATRF